MRIVSKTYMFDFLIVAVGSTVTFSSNGSLCIRELIIEAVYDILGIGVKRFFHFQQQKGLSEYWVNTLFLLL